MESIYNFYAKYVGILKGYIITTFLTALAFVIPIILAFFIVLYLHIIIIFNLFNLITYKLETEKDPLLYKWKYKGKSVLGISFLFFMLLHLMLFVDFYRSYINDKTEYHDAKVYYVAGMIPQTYSVLFGRLNTPLFPAFFGFTKPADKMKEYLFEKGSKLIPDADAEKELWEYEWYFYPYMIRMSTMYDTYHTSYGRGNPVNKITKKTHNYMYSRVERLYEIISILNEKKIADPYRDADALKKLPLMALYYKNKSQFMHRAYSIDSVTSKQFILDEDYRYRKVQLINWLQAIPDKLDYQVQYQEWGNANLKALLKIEATRQQVVLNLMDRALLDEIIAYKFHCKNETTQDYINLRNRYMVGGNNSILDRLSNHGGEKDALAMYKDSQVNPSSEFFRLILKKYCSIDVLGVDPHTSPYREKGILDSSNRLIRILDKGKINE